MSDKKQSSVEWLKDQLEHFGNKHELTVSWDTIDDLFEQAKAMHKEEITDAYWEGGQDVPVHGSQCDRYYEQTFEGK